MIDDYVVCDEAIEIIKKFEGLRLKAYKCPSGIWTIGYGHTKGVSKGQVITSEQAEELLIGDIAEACHTVSDLIEIPLSNYQFSALVSFVFNVGYARFAKSTMRKLINGGDLKRAVEQFDRWVYSGTTVLQGLVKRRAEEKALFLKTEIRPLGSHFDI